MLKYLLYKFIIEAKLQNVKKIINKFLIKARFRKIKVMPKDRDVYSAITCNFSKAPLISIIIPFKDKPALLRKCIYSILRSTYKNFEVLAINNNSVKKDILMEIEKLKRKDKRIQFFNYNIAFNFSKINNYAVKKFSVGEYLVFMNNDIELITRNWIEQFLKYTNTEQIGTIGAKLYYPNNTIQHAGIVILDKYGFCEHIGRFYKKNDKSKLFNQSRYVMANTAALMMIKREVFEKVGGFDEDLAVDYNDVDLSLKCLEKGYKNIWTPFVEAYHHESVSRGKNRNIENLKRFEKERKHIVYKHYNLIKNGDIYYKVNL